MDLQNETSENNIIHFNKSAENSINCVPARPRVLIVDDMRLIRQKIREMLDEHNFDVVGEADDGDIAVKMAAELNPDLIIMDIEMDRMNGIAATAQIKRANPLVKIIIVTNAARPSIVIESLKAGAANFITKPFDNHHVHLVIRKALSD